MNKCRIWVGIGADRLTDRYRGREKREESKRKKEKTEKEIDTDTGGDGGGRQTRIALFRYSGKDEREKGSWELPTNNHPRLSPNSPSPAGDAGDRERGSARQMAPTPHPRLPRQEK